MPRGLEVFNPDGTPRNSVEDQLTRVLGSLNVSGTGSITWPYPNVSGNRVVTTVSNRPRANNVVTTAYAYLSPDKTVVYYSQAEDLAAITLLFMVY